MYLLCIRFLLHYTSRLFKEYSGSPPVLSHRVPGMPRSPGPRRSDDAIVVATVRSSNNGGTARSVVGAVHPNPSACKVMSSMFVGTGQLCG